jgi:mediator of RNA polymerase II transcription subunit 7
LLTDASPKLDDKLPTLEEQGITNLPTTGLSESKDAKHYDRAFELKKLVKSLLLNFLELSGTLSRNPAHAEAKIQDLRTLFINIHHILNEYRPHQARESAISMMQDHLDKTRGETVAIRTQVDKARRVLLDLGAMAPCETGLDAAEGIAEAGGAKDVLARRREMEVWAAADAQFAIA